MEVMRVVGVGALVTTGMKFVVTTSFNDPSYQRLTNDSSIII